MKKHLKSIALMLVTSFCISFTPVMGYVDRNDRNYMHTSFDAGSDEFIVEPYKTECIKIEAEYNADGSLKDIKTSTAYIEDITEPDNTSLKKTFYWESLESMKPVIFEETTKPTTKPQEGIIETTVFSFGAAADGAITVDADCGYGEHNGKIYGLMDIDETSALNDDRFDGFSDDILTYPIKGEKNRISYLTADYSKYDSETLAKFGGGVIPLRFSMQGTPHKYYTVTATIINASDEESEISLFSEKRRPLLFNYKMTAGEVITKSWNVNLEGQYYNATGAYVDNAVNVAVSGKGAGLVSVKIEEHEKNGVTAWLVNDSTGDDCAAAIPYFALSQRGGVGQFMQMYINPEIAVSNHGEGGLTSSDRNHIDNALQYMQKGDYLFVEYGFNGDTADKLKKNLEYYYEEAHKRGVYLVVVSTTERHSSQFWDSSNGKWNNSNADIAAAGKEFVESINADDIAFIDLNTEINKWMNTVAPTVLEQRKTAGFNDTAVNRASMDYYYWVSRSAGVDSIHMNDAGADNAAYIVMSEAKNSGIDWLEAAVNKESTITPYRISDSIVSLGWAPNDVYPYPLAENVVYEYPIYVEGADIANNTVTLTVQGETSYYIRGAVDVLDESGNVTKTYYSTSTDVNPAIDHIDNTQMSYGDSYVMSFDNISIPSNSSYCAYAVPVENNGDSVPVAGEGNYSAYYHEKAETDTVLMETDFSDGSVWTTGGGAAGGNTIETKAGKKSLKFETNGSGSYMIFKRFNDSAGVQNGIVDLHFKIYYEYGSFIMRLGTNTKSGSYMGGMKTINIQDGFVSFEDGTEVGKIKTSRWTPIDVKLDLINGTQSISIAGGTPVTVDICALKSANANDVKDILPIYSFGAGAMNTGSTIPAYSFEAYITDINIHTEKCDIPKYIVSAVSEDDAKGSVTGGGEYDVNTSVTVTAKANDGYEFAGWYDGDTKVSSSSRYEVRLRNNINLTARFDEEMDNPNIIKWSFAPYGDNEINASAEMSEVYKTAVFHLNSGDSLTGNGLYWNAPGGTKSDSTTVVSNNRYIEFTPEKDGTISITYAGNAVKGSNWPRMYISAGSDTSCMTKDANSNQAEANKQFDNKKGAGVYDTMTAQLTGGQKYYIWAYYYGQNGIGFTISEMKYDMN